MRLNLRLKPTILVGLAGALLLAGAALPPESRFAYGAFLFFVLLVAAPLWLMLNAMGRRTALELQSFASPAISQLTSVAINPSETTTSLQGIHNPSRLDPDDQLRRITLLTQLAIELREACDPQTIAERVLHVVGGNLVLDRSLIILTTPRGAIETALRWQNGAISDLEYAQAAWLMEHGVEGWVQHLGGPAALADVSANMRWLASGHPASGSAIVLPVRLAASTLGAFTVYRDEVEGFSNHDLLLMEGVVAQVAVALSAAYRYQEERRHRQAAEALLGVSQALTVEQTHEDLAALLNMQCGALFEADQIMLYLFPQDAAPQLVLPTQGTPASAQGLHTSVLAHEAAADVFATGRPASRIGEVAGACLALPLIHAGRAIGACVVTRNSNAELTFSTERWSLLAAFINMTAAACANIELVAKLRGHAGRLEHLVELHSEALRRSRDLLRIVFDNLPEGLLLLDTDGKLLAANNAFCKGIAGRRPREVVGMNYRLLWQDLASNFELQLTPESHDGSGAQLIPALGDDFNLTPASWRVLSTDLMGQQRWHEVERIPVTNLQGEPGQYLERWRDITNHEALQRHLLLHEQLTSLGRLAASVAHEVGNPLQSALICLELCREQEELSEQSNEYLDLALKELDRLSRTMDSLRNLYRPPQVSWERVDINEILRQVVQLTRVQLEKAQVSLQVELDEHLPLIIGQPDTLRQVLLNLILNAQQAMPDGGRVVVTSRPKATDRLCVITVQDTGEGMSEQQLAHVFEPFRSGKVRGVGLGLYLSKQIIEQHRGYIEIASEQGQGTAVRILLPWNEAGPPQIRE